MAKDANLTKMLMGGAALIAAGTAAQAMSLGSSGCVLGGVLGGPVGAAIGALAGFGSSFAGGWMSNRFHEKYKALEYELNDPSDVLRNHFLRRLVTQAIRLGIRQGVEGSIKDQDTIKALRDLESLAVSFFERDAEVADTLTLNEAQLERFFTGRWDDVERVETPNSTAWRAFLEEAAGTNTGMAMKLAIGIAADTLEASFTRLLFDNAKLASENDRPAYAALELMLVRTLANTLADHGQTLGRIDASTTRSEAELIVIKAELASLRESLATLPTRLESRLVLPDLQSFNSLRVSAHQTGLIVPRAVASLEARLTSIEALLGATYEVVREIGAVQRGDRKLLARLPLVGESIRDGANRDWTVRELLSTGSAGCVALAEHRGKRTVFKISVIEDFARSFAREVEAATTLQDIAHDHARFCEILDSKLPVVRKAGATHAEAAVLPPYWIQLEYFPLGNLATWWKAAAPTGPEQVEQAAALVADIARTVEIAHGQGVLHRDLKPANILMREDRLGAVVPHVSDFGIASFTDPERSASLQEHAGGRTIHTKGMDAVSYHGTLLYMAPELYERSADNRPPASPSVPTDVYSLGMILYWLVTGRQERPSRELVQAHVADRVLGYVIRRATHREPERRYQNAAALVKELDTRAALIPRLPELEDVLLSDAERLALEKERVQASEAQRARAERERARAEEQSARALRLVKQLRWSTLGLVVLATIAIMGFVLSTRRAESERLAKFDAEQQQRVAATRTAEAEAARASESKAREAVEHRSYVASIQAAAESIDLRQFARVRQRLDECPERLRGWEWKWLNARSDNSLLTIETACPLPEQVAVFSPDGSRIAISCLGLSEVFDSVSGARLATGGGISFATKGSVFSPDGLRVVTPGLDSAKIVTVDTPDNFVWLGSHGADVETAAFNHDATLVVTASRDNTARIWDACTGNSIVELRGHTGPVVSAFFSPNGERVITKSIDGTVRAWETTTGTSLFIIEADREDGFVILSPGGKRLLTKSRRGIDICVWDGITGAKLGELNGHSNEITSALFSHDGARIVTASADRTARIWDTSTLRGLGILKGHTAGLHGAEFSRDGRRIVTASADNTARVWDASSGALMADLRGHTRAVYAASFSPDGTCVVTASMDSTARIWDSATESGVHVLRKSSLSGDNVLAAFDPAGTRLVTTGPDNVARVWYVALGFCQTEFREHLGPITSASFSPDGRLVVTSSADKTARVWDAMKGTARLVLRGHTNNVRHCAFSHDGTRVATSSDDFTARIWDAVTGAGLDDLVGHTAEVNTVVFSPDDKWLLTSSADKTARVWDASSGTCIATLEGHTETVWMSLFNRDGTRIATISADGSTKIWEVGTWSCIATLGSDSGFVTCAAFSPDGRRIAIGGGSNAVQLWELSSASCIGTLTAHASRTILGFVNKCEFSPDGSRLVTTASEDNAALLWDATTGSAIAELRGHSDIVMSATFSPDGTRIVTTSRDGSARVWDSVEWRERYKELKARGLRK